MEEQKDFTAIQAPNKNMSPFKKPLLNSHNQCLITEDNGKKSRPQHEASTGVISVITGLTFVAMHYGKVQ